MKKINKARIIQQLTSKFSLNELENEPFQLTETVTPTYDIETFMRPIISTDYTVASDTSGYKTIFTTADGKRHYIYLLSANLTTGTTARATELYFKNASNQRIQLAIKSATTNFHLGLIGMPIIIPAGCTLELYLGTGNAGDVFTVTVVQAIEDAI